MRWFISDTHFGHKNVIEYSQRPFKSVKQMDDTMIARWNRNVKDDDQVFMLGDFGLVGINYLTDVLHSLNGNKILIRGNHDGSIEKMRRIGFDCVVDGAIVTIEGYEVLLSHYPNLFENEQLRLHGHIHEKGKPVFENGQMCVCVELWNYTPISEKTIGKMIRDYIKQGDWKYADSCKRRPVGRGGEANGRGSSL